jgi:hypothetical protein
MDSRLTSTFQSVDRKTCSILRRPIVVSVAVIAHSWSTAASLSECCVAIVMTVLVVVVGNDTF